jgi:hypothetical protein
LNRSHRQAVRDALPDPQDGASRRLPRLGFRVDPGGQPAAFNCRDATGSSSWSEHAFGLAVDLDPCENPHISADGYEAHPRCRKYVGRSLHDPGVIHADDKVVRESASPGGGWGGTWQGARDYQHFSANGR